MGAVKLDLAWCPRCADFTSAHVGQPCAWCDTGVTTLQGG